jgi:hypothetical protein
MENDRIVYEVAWKGSGKKGSSPSPSSSPILPSHEVRDLRGEIDETEIMEHASSVIEILLR